VAAAGAGFVADPLWAARHQGMRCAADAPDAARIAAAKYAMAARAGRAARRDAWFEWVSHEMDSGGRRVFRWVLSPAPLDPPPLVPAGAGWKGDPAAEHRVAAAAWCPPCHRPDALGWLSWRPSLRSWRRGRSLPLLWLPAWLGSPVAWLPGSMVGWAMSSGCGRRRAPGALRPS
jgi:hypothetical protein